MAGGNDASSGAGVVWIGRQIWREGGVDRGWSVAVDGKGGGVGGIIVQVCGCGGKEGGSDGWGDDEGATNVI